MGLIFYIGLILLRVPFAIPLALLVGIFEIVPTVGPILAVIPAIIVGFGVTPITGFAVAALSFLLHQLEAYIFVPKVMQKSVGISPIITLASLVIGLKLAGVVGAILSVPVVIAIQVFSKEYLVSK
jgi:predicted PurR-regulated permease PerM